MKNYSVMLNEIYAGLKGMPSEECRLDCYVSSEQLDGVSRRMKAAVLICPGGGYRFVSQREAEPIALEFVARGYNAYVLTYSTVDGTRFHSKFSSKEKSAARFPVQLLQGWAAMRYIYETKGKHGTDETRISVCGFSAGGHLAGSIGALWNSAEVNGVFGANRGYKVYRMILCYPVISSIVSPHSDSFMNLSGSKESEKWSALSLERLVTEATPPTFLWHTSNDNVVDVRNSLAMGAQLRECGVPFEMHIYPVGTHGLSLANEITCNNNPAYVMADCAQWLELADKFLRKKL